LNRIQLAEMRDLRRMEHTLRDGHKKRRIACDEKLGASY
jgi:hypothetical protein